MRERQEPFSHALSTLRTKIVHNAVLWGILIGFVLSLSKLGPNPTYLDPAYLPGSTTPRNTDFVRGLAWIDEV